MNLEKDLSIEEIFKKAIAYHNNKKLNLAENLYNEVLKKDPLWILTLLKRSRF